MEEKQVFTTFDGLMVFGLILSVVIIFATLISNGVRDNRLERAATRTKQLASQILIGGYKKGLTDEINLKYPTRNIASVGSLDLKPAGRIGMDPWGVPYFYRVFLDKKNATWAIVVSSGPDRILNTHPDFFASETQMESGAPSILGDDIGTKTTGP